MCSSCQSSGSSWPSTQTFARSVVSPSPVTSEARWTVSPSCQVSGSGWLASTVPSRWISSHMEPSARCQTRVR